MCGHIDKYGTVKKATEGSVCSVPNFSSIVFFCSLSLQSLLSTALQIRLTYADTWTIMANLNVLIWLVF